MTFALSSRQRATLLFLSASGYVAWFSGLGERIEAQGLPSGVASTVTIVEPNRAPSVAGMIRRDPFSGKPQDHALPGVAVSPPAPDDDAGVGSDGGTRMSSAAAQAIASGAGGVAVPNIGTEPNVVAQASVSTLTLALRATITGPDPVAYVENGAVMDIVRVGDTLGERRIAKIDLRGIAFADGTRLDLPETASFSPQSAARPTTPRAAAPRALTIDDLRKLLVPRPQTAGPSAQAQTPPPVQTATYPTPGPLPTVDQRGLPVGVNPTPDPNAPTPFPYPYPYAPPAPHER